MNENINFEVEMNKLKMLATDLENGNLSLEDSVKKFTESVEISSKLQKYLDDIKTTINTNAAKLQQQQGLK
jgi:exodeoxyribonuclease VII small subunit